MKNQMTKKTVRPVTARVAKIQITSFPGVSFLTNEKRFEILFFFKYPSMLYLKSFHFRYWDMAHIILITFLVINPNIAKVEGAANPRRQG
jgi:hypothetical protein